MGDPHFPGHPGVPASKAPKGIDFHRACLGIACIASHAPEMRREILPPGVRIFLHATGATADTGSARKAPLCVPPPRAKEKGGVGQASTPAGLRCSRLPRSARTCSVRRGTEVTMIRRTWRAHGCQAQPIEQPMSKLRTAGEAGTLAPLLARGYTAGEPVLDGARYSLGAPRLNNWLGAARAAPAARAAFVLAFALPLGTVSGQSEPRAAAPGLELLRVHAGAGGAVFRVDGQLLLVRAGDTIGSKRVRLVALGADRVTLELPEPEGPPLEYQMGVGEVVHLPTSTPQPPRVQRLHVTDRVDRNDD